MEETNPTPAAETPATPAEELGYLELLRQQPEAPDSSSSPSETDRVLTRIRPSAWSY